MSRFYGDITGTRGNVTKRGNKKSGLSGHIRGWISGISIYCNVNEKDEDVIEAYATNGSSNNNKSITGLLFRSIDGKIDYLTTKKSLKK